MLRRIGLLLLVGWLAARVVAQDGLDLPARLYVLTNSGVVQEYGIGAQGVTNVTPQDEFVVDFGVAPDGNWLVYRTQTELKLKTLYAEGASTPLAGLKADAPPVRGRGDTIAWSPSGDAFVYTTQFGGIVYFFEDNTSVELREGPFTQVSWSPDGRFLAAEVGKHIWWLYRRQDKTLKLTSALPSSVGMTWFSPSELVFAPEDGALILMNLDSANKQTLLLDATWVYGLPYQTPDGSLAVFGRQKSDSVVPSGSGRLLGLETNPPKVNNLGQVAIEFEGLRWSPGGKLMIALRGGVMALVIPTDGQGITLPTSEVVAYSWGPPLPEGVTGLRLPSPGYFIAEDAKGIAQVWRLPADGKDAVAITEAEANVTAYAVSANNRSVAFVSGSALWIKPVSSAQPVTKLMDVGAETTRGLTFNPDGSQIAYGVSGGVSLISARGGEPKQVIGSDPKEHGNPRFAPDGRALIVERGFTAPPYTEYVRVELNTLEARGLASGFGTVWLRDGSALVYALLPTGGAVIPTEQVIYRLTRQDTTLPAPLVTLPPTPVIQAAREIAAGRVRLAFNQGMPSRLSVADLSVTDGQLTPVGDAGFIYNALLAPNGTFIAGYTTPDQKRSLTFRDLKTGRQVVLTQPPNARDFQWAAS